jgi:hypothetical protein
MNRRRDRLAAVLVDAALHTSSVYGVQLAALNMKSYGIGRDVIMRVLTLPRQRRGPGQRAAGLEPSNRSALAEALDS